MHFTNQRSSLMKKIIILLIILLIGVSATAGAFISTSLGWTFKPADESSTLTFMGEEKNQNWNITLELSDEPFVWVEPDEVETILGNISFQLPSPVTDDLALTVDKASYITGENVTITLENRGTRTSYFTGSETIWSIEQYRGNGWEKIYPDVLLAIFTETRIDPGEIKEYIWDQTTTINGQVETGDYRVSIDYYLDEEKYGFTEYVYFSISNTNTLFGSFTFQNSSADKIYSLPDYPLFWGEDEKIVVTSPSSQMIPYDDFFPKVPIENVSMGKYINATDSITIYDITDSIKIYDPDGGYWWLPVFPYSISK